MKQETEAIEIVKEVKEVHEGAQIQATQENQLSHTLTSTDTLEVTEVVKDEYVEISKEQKDVIEKQEVVQLTAIEVTQHIETTEAKAEESDMPMEENEEAMLPEDGILLTYVVKQSWKNNETEVADNLIRPVTEVPEYVADIPMSRDNDEISENLQKSHEMKEQVEDIVLHHQ